MKTRNRLNIFELVFIINFYGNLLLLVSVISIISLFLVVTTFSLPLYYYFITIIPIILATYGINVTAKLIKKDRIASNMLKELERGFTPKYFRIFIGDLCMRLLTRYVLLKTGLLHRYNEIVIAAKENSSYMISSPDPETRRLIEEGFLKEEEIIKSISKISTRA